MKKLSHYIKSRSTSLTRPSDPRACARTVPFAHCCLASFERTLQRSGARTRDCNVNEAMSDLYLNHNITADFFPELPGTR